MSKRRKKNKVAAIVDTDWHGANDLSDDDFFDKFGDGGTNAETLWGDKVKIGKGKHRFSNYAPCHVTHKPMPIIIEGGEFEIHGGSCHDPKIKGCNVYIGFDAGMAYHTSYPWTKIVPTEFLYKITDMCAPTDVNNFKQMVKWTIEQLKLSNKIHAGCIGGHGRTGLFFSALVKEAMGLEDATTYVRENYCERAVESPSQINFLHKHYGIIKVESTKLDFGYDDYNHKGKKGKKGKKGLKNVSSLSDFGYWGDKKGLTKPSTEATDDIVEDTGSPLVVAGNIWGIKKDQV